MSKEERCPVCSGTGLHISGMSNCVACKGSGWKDGKVPEEMQKPKDVPSQKVEVAEDGAEILKEEGICPNCSASLSFNDEGVSYCEECGWPDIRPSEEKDNAPPTAKREGNVTAKLSDMVKTLPEKYQQIFNNQYKNGVDSLEGKDLEMATLKYQRLKALYEKG